MGAPSPDGRYISFVDWPSNSNLSILDLNTKEKKCLTDFKNDGEQAYYSSWSPDGKKLAFFWWEMGDNEDRYNISVVDITGNNQKKLYTSEKVNWIELGNWSSDGKYILATLSIRDHPESQIVRISTSDGSLEILKYYDISYLGGKPWFSPDNRYIAYDLPDEKASGNSDIHILSIENKSDNPLFKHPAHDNILGWTPEGNNILFASDRTGSVDAMIIPVQEGKSTGKPVSVKSNIGHIVPMGFTQKGSFYYGDWPEEQNIYSTEIDFENGKVITKPTLAIKRFEGKNGSPYYSNDGKFLAYISRRGIGTSGTVLCVRELETGKEIEITQQTEISNTISHPTWSPDDRSIALMTRKGGNQSIYNYNLQTKKYSPLFTDPDKQSNGVDFIYPQWSPDGKTIYYFELSQRNQTSYIKARNIETENDKVLFQYSSEDFMDRIFTIALSPDGKWISAINRGENRMIKLISTNGEETKDLDNFILPGGNSLPQFWSNDGKYIIYAFNTENRTWNLKRIPIGDGEKSEIEINILGINSPNLHPDGRHLIFSSLGFSFPKNTIWEMENFLPSKNQETAAKEPEGIRIRQISKKPFLDDFGTVSRDGRYLSFVDWEDGELAILDLNTGEKRILTKNATLDENPEKFVIGSAISKNGKKVAYSWWRPYHTFDLHIFDIEKNSDKLLYKEDNVEAYPVAWRTDNEIIVIRRDINKELTQVTLFNVLDGTFQELKTGWPGLCVSPDGNFLAYSTKKGGQSNSDIYLLTIDKKDEVPLIVHPANDKVIGWIPNRAEFLFISDRSGTWDLWSIQIINGKPSGEPRRLFSEIGEVEPVGITEKGECFIGFRKRNFNAYILSVNKLTGKPEGNPEIPLSGSIYSKNWSPDGKYMVRAQEGRRSFDLILREEQTGIEKRLAKELMYAIGPYWTSDAQSVYFYGMDQKMLQNKGYKGGIYKVDINSNNLEQKLLISDYGYTPSEDDALPISGHVVSDDQQYIYLLFQNDWIVKHDLNTGKDTILYRHPKFVRGVLQLSPDGNKLLFAIQNKGEKMSRLMTISTQGGDEKELCTSQESNISGSAFWSPDGKYVYFSERPEGTNLWRVDANGGTPEKVWKTEKRAESFVMHPSGEKISYSVRERITEVRVIEGLVNELNKIYSQNE